MTATVLGSKKQIKTFDLKNTDNIFLGQLIL